MKSVFRLLTIALPLAMGAPAGAQQPGHPPPFMGQLFPPEMVMQFQRKIGVTPAQRETLTGAIKGIQAKMVDLQWALKDEHQKFAELLAADRVDQGAALDQAKRMMDIERTIKTTHLAFLIQIKNLLTPEQQATLRQIRPAAERRPRRN